MTRHPTHHHLTLTEALRSLVQWSTDAAVRLTDLAVRSEMAHHYPQENTDG